MLICPKCGFRSSTRSSDHLYTFNFFFIFYKILIIDTIIFRFYLFLWKKKWKIYVRDIDLAVPCGRLVFETKNVERLFPNFKILERSGEWLTNRSWYTNVSNFISQRYKLFNSKKHEIANWTEISNWGEICKLDSNCQLGRNCKLAWNSKLDRNFKLSPKLQLGSKLPIGSKF